MIDTVPGEQLRILICAPSGFAQRCAELLDRSVTALGRRAEIVVDVGESASSNPQRLQGVFDHALLWRPPQDLLQRTFIRGAAFSLGAGVEDLLRLNPPDHLKLVKLEDAGLSEQIADFVHHAVLREHRRLEVYRQQQSLMKWERHRPSAKAEYRVGVLGLGSIGSRIARVIAEAGYRVSALSRTPHSLKSVECVTGVAAPYSAQDDNSPLARFVRELDVLVCALPATPLSRGVLCAELFRRMKTTAHLVNVGRGEHLQEEDLLSSLRGGEIAGATLDVFEQEPLPAQHPFWCEPRVVVTPHIAGTPHVPAAVEQIAAKIDKLEAGLQISGVVSIENGY